MKVATYTHLYWPQTGHTRATIYSHNSSLWAGHCLAHGLYKGSCKRVFRATTTRHNGQWYVYFPPHRFTCSLTAVGEKRSADEADLATRDDGAKRRESPGTGKDTKRGPKVRVPLVVLTAPGFLMSHSHHPTRVVQAIPASVFKAHAVPLHVTVTDTPPTARDDNCASPESVDQGILGTVALQPCTFTTKSYGWKGSRRFAIDIVDPVSGEKNTVQVMLSYVFLTIEFLPCRANE
jgi:hypothetical protein